MSKKIFLFAALLYASFQSYAQVSNEYASFVKKAMAFYDAKQYQQSADEFSHAFAANGGKGYPDDRYNAACSWALAGNKDSAFFQLDRIATRSGYKDYNHMSTDGDLVSLHGDSRWVAICALVKQNKEKSEEGLNKPLVGILDTVLQEDQADRMRLPDIQKKYGYDSKEIKEL